MFDIIASLSGFDDSYKCKGWGSGDSCANVGDTLWSTSLWSSPCIA